MSSTPPPEDEFVPFLSLASLRDTHRELMETRRNGQPSDEFWSRVMDFLQRGQASGAYLDIDDERATAQNLLDYWENQLFHEGKKTPEAILAEFDPTQFPEIPDHLCPYVGLDAFRAENQHLFYGRSQLIDDLLRHVMVNQLIAVVGPSGSGKSSVVLAGLLPRLRNGALPDSRNWRYFNPIVPGSAPLARLARMFQPPDVAVEEWLPEQISQLRENHHHLATLANQDSTHPAVIVIDQFEETFTLCHDEEERTAFINNILNLVRSRGPRHLVILTMRTDYESYLEKVALFKSMFEQGEVRVSAMNAGELREAIEKPAESVGLKFEEGLVDRLIREILGEPAALPLLQFALLQLWDNRERNRVTWESYRRIGSVMQALGKTADALYDSLLTEEQVTARRIMMQIVRPSEGLEVTRNRVRREALYATGEAADRIDRVLDKLVQARLVLLTEGAAPEDDQVEVAHEALVRNWPRLIEWLDEERVVLRRRQRLTTQAEQWDARQRDDTLLLRGWLLEEAKKFSGLNPIEKAFVEASETAVNKAARKEEDRRQRELAQAQELARRAEQIAEEQKAKAKAEALAKEQAELAAQWERKRADTQRRFLIALAVLFIVTVGGLVLGFNARQQRQEAELAALAADATIRAQAVMEETLVAKQTVSAREQATSEAQIATAQAEQTASAIEQATVTVQIAQSQAEASTRTVLDATEEAQDAAATSTVQFQLISEEATRSAQATATAVALNPVVRTPTLQPTAVIGQYLQTAQLEGFLRSQDNMPVLFVTGSRFEMGPPNASSAETVDDFYIDQYEVTVRQYAAFLNNIGGYENACDGFDCAATGFETQFTYLLNNFGVLQPKAGFERYPINWVSWYGARAYCQWAGGDLPTMSQWEYTARSIDGRSYPWGITAPTSNLAIFGGSANSNSFFSKLRPVDALPDGSSPFGAYNMAGSVREWVLDNTDRDDSSRILRGGSWISPADEIFAYSQSELPANLNALTIDQLAYWDVGFRCAMPTSARP